MKIGLRKRQRGLDAIIVSGVPVWMLADAQTNSNVSDVHVQWFSHWKIRADNCDVMKGTIKGEHNQISGLLSGSSDTKH